MITLTNVSKYFDQNHVIQDISLTINQGEIIGLLGPNGAGKTTTTRMIAGVLPPTKGKIIVNQQNLYAEDYDPNSHSMIGYLPEDNPLYDDITVEESLLYWANLKNIKKEDQLKMIKKVVLSTGLTDVYYRPIDQLSKGFRQRTGLAQAILGDPQILLLDEPTEGLDPNQRKDIHSLITDIGHKRTIVICSHVLSEITKICNRIIIINKGKIVADSPTEEIGNLSGSKYIYEFIASGKNIEQDLQSLEKNINIAKAKLSPAFKYTIQTTNKKDLRLDIFNLAKKHSWQLYELTRKAQDLEDIFASLTK